jgi:hypothetical protein
MTRLPEVLDRVLRPAALPLVLAVVLTNGENDTPIVKNVEVLF